MVVYRPVIILGDEATRRFIELQADIDDVIQGTGVKPAENRTVEELKVSLTGVLGLLNVRNQTGWRSIGAVERGLEHNFRERNSSAYEELTVITGSHGTVYRGGRNYAGMSFTDPNLSVERDIIRETFSLEGDESEVNRLPWLSVCTFGLAASRLVPKVMEVITDAAPNIPMTLGEVGYGYRYS